MLYVVGTLDTKGDELRFVRDVIAGAGLDVALVDVSTSGRGEAADVSSEDVAAFHPDGAGAVFVDERGSSVAAMAEALARFFEGRDDVEGVIGLGGSSGTALISPALRTLPIGTPKVMVSTMASGEVRPYVGGSDIAMIYPVTDIAGLNRVSTAVLANAANALVGMATGETPAVGRKPAVAMTMFGVTMPCVTRVRRSLDSDYDCLVFHATGSGGAAMEALVDEGTIAAVIDVTTTEVADEVVGGVLSAGPGRLDAIGRTSIPYVGSCGALDMVNFGPLDTVPERFKDRNLVVHNPQVTLMRTTPDEGAAIGRWIAMKLNRCRGPVRFLLPTRGLSSLDAVGEPFHDPEADAALFDSIERTFDETAGRRLIRSPHHINDPAFADALLDAFHRVVEAGAEAARR